MVRTGEDSLEVQSFVRAQELRALLEAGAIVCLFDALEILIAHADAGAACGDAIAEHHAASFRRRRDELVREHAVLTGGPQDGQSLVTSGLL
jgi:hypothetical protein